MRTGGGHALIDECETQKVAHLQSVNRWHHSRLSKAYGGWDALGHQVAVRLCQKRCIVVASWCARVLDHEIDLPSKSMQMQLLGHRG